MTGPLPLHHIGSTDNRDMYGNSKNVERPGAGWLRAYSPGVELQTCRTVDKTGITLVHFLNTKWFVCCSLILVATCGC